MKHQTFLLETIEQIRKFSSGWLGRTLSLCDHDGKSGLAADFGTTAQTCGSHFAIAVVSIKHRPNYVTVKTVDLLKQTNSKGISNI